MAKLNISQLYAKVFNLPNVKLLDSEDTINHASTPSGVLSVLGTPIFSQITFRQNNKDAGFTLPDCPLIEISTSKTIIETPIQGRNGTVKEYISANDYTITIRGILINNESDKYPFDLVDDLHKIYKLNTALMVTNTILNMLDINQVVMKELKFMESEGYSHIQPFNIECVSDETLELMIMDATKQ
jgi:hypothetical protein